MAAVKNSEGGFSYIDVMIGLVILMVGILACAAALTANLVRSLETEKQVVAKQIALSTIESIFSARDIGKTGGVSGWDKIGNLGANPDPTTGINQGLFLTGFCPIRQLQGLDGVVGTADDACAGSGSCVQGDGTNNTSTVMYGFERQIVITDLDDPERPFPQHAIARRRIDVTVRYSINSLQRQQTVSTIITNYEE